MARLQYIKADYVKAQSFIKRYERAARNFSSSALALAYKINQKKYQQRVAKNYAGMLIKMFPNSYETKQYLLDELSDFEADEFADIYRLQQISKRKMSSKKKVVVSLPAIKSSIQKPTASASAKRSPSNSAFTTALTKSVPSRPLRSGIKL